MKFRIATWNMNHWQQRNAEARQQAWLYLDSLGADAVLVQEAVPPEGYPQVVWNQIDSKNRLWGSGVVSRRWKLTEITRVKDFDLLQTWRGAVAVAQIDLPDTPPIILISCYGLIDKGYAQTTMYRIIADLIPLFDSALGKYVILAGDLNITTQMKGAVERKRHTQILESIKSLGLMDCLELTKETRTPIENCACLEAPNCGHVITHQHNSGSLMHIDYTFATESLAKKLIRCFPHDEQVEFPLTENGKWKLSDHCPIIAEYDL